MKVKIDFTFMKNKKIYLKLENYLIKKDDNLLEIEIDNSINQINLEDKTFIRENNDFLFRLDFKNKTSDYMIKKMQKKYFIKVNYASFINRNKIICLKYNLETENEENEIIIHFLEHN